MGNEGRSAQKRGIKTGSRVGFEGMLEVLLRYRGEARCENELDRRHVLFRLTQELSLSEEDILARGFDKAYRRMVEGV